MHTGAPLLMTDYFNEDEYLKAERIKFQKELIKSVGGLKSDINSIKEDMKSIKMRPSAKNQIKDGISKKALEIK